MTWFDIGIEVGEELIEANKRIDAARILLADALGLAHRFTTGEYDLKCGHIQEPLLAMADELRELAYAIENLTLARKVIHLPTAGEP